MFNTVSLRDTLCEFENIHICIGIEIKCSAHIDRQHMLRILDRKDQNVAWNFKDI